MWTASDFDPNVPNVDWAFANGTPMSEFLWGTWLWMALLAAVLAVRRPRPRRRLVVWFEATAAVLQLAFLASTAFYTTVRQSDMKNFGQTLGGLAASTLALLIFQARVHWRRRKEQGQGREFAALLILNESDPDIQPRSMDVDRGQDGDGDGDGDGTGTWMEVSRGTIRLCTPP